MRAYGILLLVMGVLLLSPLSGDGSEPSGRDIALNMKKADSSSDSKRTTAMLIQRGTQKLGRKMEVFVKKFEGDERRLIRFVDPPDVRGVLYLTRSYEDPERTDDLWVFLPAENLTRRISGGAKKGPFMRSDLANEDLETRAVDDDEHKLLRSEQMDGFDCYLVEMTNKRPEDSTYVKRMVWVRKDVWLPVRTEFYDQSEERVKVARFSGFEQIEGIWTITRMVFEKPSRNTRTYMQYSDIDYNYGAPDSLFEQSNLKR